MPKESEEKPLLNTYWKHRGLICDDTEMGPSDEQISGLDSKNTKQILSFLDEKDPVQDFVGRH